MEEPDFLDSLVNRRVAFRHNRRELQFDLSTALFSSAGVDAGTASLLRALDETLRDRQPASLLDVGCGTGTLGITLAATTGGALTATDRDALAVHFTSRNAALNGIEPVRALAALGGESPFGESVRGSPDLVVSNLPAKAGEPVLRHLIAALAGLAGADGVVGVVVVKTLEGLLTDTLSQIGAQTLHVRRTAGHSAIVYAGGEPRDNQSFGRGGEAEEGAADPAALLHPAYVRGIESFTGPHGTYKLTVAFNLAEFDSLGYGTELAFRLFRIESPGGRAFFWGCGQGHLPVGGIRRAHHGEVIVADRDLLAIATSVTNLRATHQRSAVVPLIAPSLASAVLQDSSPVDWMIVRSEPEPGSRWADEIVFAAERMVSPSGRLLVVSRSTSLARLAPVIARSFTCRETVRHHGYRADLLSRKH